MNTTAAKKLMLDAQREFEGRFAAVHRPIETFPERVNPLGNLRDALDIQPETVKLVEVISIPSFPVTTEDYGPAGDLIWHETPESAIALWEKRAVSMWHPGADLYWRVLPKISFECDFETQKAGWKVYSRFGVRLRQRGDELAVADNLRPFTSRNVLIEALKDIIAEIEDK